MSCNSSVEPGRALGPQPSRLTESPSSCSKISRADHRSRASSIEAYCPGVIFNLARADGGYLVCHECMQPPIAAQQAHQPFRALGSFDSKALSPHVQHRLVSEVMRGTFAYLSDDDPISAELTSVADSLAADKA